ncbi:MAG: hypothetical protein IH968_07405 [Gemmatimonadetes bacterium]|nr:hypothetical protein [Gemmatimonadota bacterium]
MIRFGLVATLLGFGFLILVGDVDAQTSADGVHIVTVRMVDKSATQYVFEPADITVAPGTLVRFELAGSIPHNVEFKSGPPGTDLGNATMGPFLLAKGQIYEIMIDARFAVGTHDYVCTPHEMMGMKGTITVLSGDPDSRRDRR